MHERLAIIRADASVDIGSGHIMRMLVLAAELAARGVAVHFVCRALPGHLAPRIREAGFPVALIAPQYDGATVCAKLLAAGSVSALIVDHYGLDARWEDSTGAAKVIVFDDLADRVHNCDLLVDQNLGRSALDYRGLVPDRARILAGVEWAMLAPAFFQMRSASLERRRDGRLRSVLISFGGGDPANATSRALIALRGAVAQALKVQVVLGAQASTEERVRRAATSLDMPVTVAVDVRDMAARLCRVDLAIGAAGTSVWERCCLGVPSIAIAVAENQRPVLAELVKEGAAQPADLDTLEEGIPAALATLGQPEKLREMSAAAAALVDGQGASRVADAILHTLN